MGADDIGVFALVALGELYQRAAQKLDVKDLRSFLLHQGEWLIHLGRTDHAALDQYVTQTQEYLSKLIRLGHPARRYRRRPVMRLVDKN